MPTITNGSTTNSNVLNAIGLGMEKLDTLKTNSPAGHAGLTQRQQLLKRWMQLNAKQFLLMMSFH